MSLYPPDLPKPRRGIPKAATPRFMAVKSPYRYDLLYQIRTMADNALLTGAFNDRQRDRILEYLESRIPPELETAHQITDYLNGNPVAYAEYREAVRWN